MVCSERGGIIQQALCSVICFPSLEATGSNLVPPSPPSLPCPRGNQALHALRVSYDSGVSHIDHMPGRLLLRWQGSPMHKVDAAWKFIPSTPRYMQKRAGQLELRPGQPQIHQTDHDTVGSGQMSGTLATCLGERCPQSRRCAEQGHWNDHGDLTQEAERFEFVYPVKG